MPKTAVGLQIRADRAEAARVKGGWKGAVVERVWDARLDPEHPAAGIAALGLPADPVVTGLPADRVFPRRVQLAFTDRNRIAQAAPLEAEETLPLPLEDLVWDTVVLGRTGSGSRCLVVAAPADAVADRVDLAAQSGLRLEAVEPEPLALAGLVRAAGLVPAWVCHLEPDRVQLVAVGPGDDLGFSCLPGGGADPDVLDQVALGLEATGLGEEAPLYLSGPLARETDPEAWAARLGRPVERLPLPAGVQVADPEARASWPDWAVALGHGLREVWRPARIGANLLQGPFAPADRGAAWKGPAIRAAVYAAVLLALWGGAVAMEIAHRKAQYDALRAAVRERFHEVLPEVTNVVSEVDQMAARVEELENRARSLGSLVDREISPLRLLRDISARIPKEIEVELRDFVVEENRVRLEGVTVSFDAIDKIKADLAEHPRFTEVAVSDAKTLGGKDKVLFKLTLSLGKKG
ncbi:MAG: hypothetical protein D6708_09960 [Candidatus Dadabacteria bacterium]|nr:MAG: hypothetical protein D6708_09960 [Candidatus Dadabacteria bacterium]